VSARIGVITFPGSLDDVDAARAARYAGADAVPLWHADEDLKTVDAVLIPGGFSYGDYLRAGAIAAQAPVMRSVIDAARGGLPVLGICNGFQVLCEAGLLPGALMRNAGLRFICRDQRLRVDSTDSVWTSGYTVGQQIVIPMKNAEGRYVAAGSDLEQLEGDGLVILRYAGVSSSDSGPAGGNPNGSLHDIAGIRSADGRVAGLMPHPEHAIDTLTGPTDDGLAMFTAMIAALEAEAAGPVESAGPWQAAGTGNADPLAEAAFTAAAQA